MVKRERPRPVVGVEHDRRLRVVGSPGVALGPGQENRRDRVEARVPRRVRIRAELADELDIERGLLAGLADGGRLQGLAVVDETARQRPAGGRVLALDEDDAPAPSALHDLDDDVDGGEGVSELGAGHRDARSSGAIVGVPAACCQFRNVPIFHALVLARGQSLAGGLGLQAGTLARKMLI